MTGCLNLVSVGPGFAEYIAPQAVRALEASDTVVAYDYYLKWIAPWVSCKDLRTTPLTQERERSLMAIELARSGRNVCLVSGGDIGIYAMAALAFEQMTEDDTFSVNVIPGITAATACASLLGAPLSHDFATLSLSDLLCPWQWIEARARHIAQADLSAVLYNVQSRSRQEGVYRVLKIMAEYKHPETLCGIVRHAYRPEQSVAIAHLAELLDMQFDMFTTIVIGNRFTRRKRGWIYTPRGYSNWSEPEARSQVEEYPDIPPEAVWVFSGTSDGNALANEIAALNYKVVVSAATAYGGQAAAAVCPRAHVLHGRQGKEKRKDLLLDRQARLIVDATHPFALKISAQLMEIASELSLPYIRFERASAGDEENVHSAESPLAAADLAIHLGRRIFLSTGSKDLETFLKAPRAGERQWFVRVTPDPDVIQQAQALGLPASRLCAMQGPFSRGFNESLWRQWQIDCVVTKDSGAAGGYQAKVEAAAALAIPLVVIKRPLMEYPALASEFSTVIEYVRTEGRAR